MKEIKLISLEVENFKGLTIALEFNGDSKNIEGKNGIGKTRIIDAYSWLLNGKDSEGRTDGKGGFDVLPQNEKGETIPDLTAKVIALLSIDGEIIKIGREYSEVWQRIKGTSTIRMTSHKSTFILGDREVKKAEFNSFLNSIAPEKVIKLLSSITEFVGLPWKESRFILIEMIGGTKSDSEILSSNEKFKIIESDIKKTPSIDVLTSDLKSSKTKSSKKVDEDKIRIEEARLSIPEALNFKEIKEGISLTEIKIKQCEQLVKDKSSAYLQYVEDREKITKEISKKKAKLSEIEAQINLDNSEAKTKQQSKINSLSSEITISKNRLIDLEKEKKEAVDSIFKIEEEAEKLREEYRKEAAVIVAIDTENLVCACCGEPLRGENKESKIKEATENFNLNKNRKLTSIKDKGSKLVDDIKAKQKLISSITLRENDINIPQLESDFLTLKEEPIIISDHKTDTSCIEIANSISLLAKELATIIEPKNTEAEKQEEILKGLRIELQNLQLNLNVEKQIEEANKRVQLLTFNRNQMIQELANIEQKLILIEDFIQLKIGAVEPKINSLFENVKFILFERNMNGGLEEKCTPIVDGKNLNTNVNTAAKVNAGIEIINRLSEFYSVNLPIFIDNKESTHNLITSDSQIITLEAKKGINELKIN